MLVSIITATYNSSHTILDCLNSIALQDYPNVEHIIIDGGSTDNTLNIIYEKSKLNTRIISEDDNGIYDALNKGIKLANGDIIGFLHSDDIFESNNILTVVVSAFMNSDIDAVYGDLYYVDKNNCNSILRSWKSSPFDKFKLVRGWMPPHPTLYVRKKHYHSIDFFDTSYRISADYHSILKLFTLNDFKSKYIPQVFVRMRVGGASNRSFSAIILKSKEDWIALKSVGFNFIECACALFLKNASKIKQFKLMK